MHSKTLALHLLESEFPALYERLRAERVLLKALDRYSSELVARCDRLREELSCRFPSSDESQISSQALEIAIEELRSLLSAKQLHVLTLGPRPSQDSVPTDQSPTRQE
jgi:hypothetical protein